MLRTSFRVLLLAPAVFALASCGAPSGNARFVGCLKRHGGVVIHQGRALLAAHDPDLGEGMGGDKVSFDSLEVQTSDVGRQALVIAAQPGPWSPQDDSPAAILHGLQTTRDDLSPSGDQVTVLMPPARDVTGAADRCAYAIDPGLRAP